METAMKQRNDISNSHITKNIISACKDGDFETFKKILATDSQQAFNLDKPFSNQCVFKLQQPNSRKVWLHTNEGDHWTPLMMTLCHYRADKPGYDQILKELLSVHHVPLEHRVGVSFQDKNGRQQSKFQPIRINAILLAQMYGNLNAILKAINGMEDKYKSLQRLVLRYSDVFNDFKEDEQTTEVDPLIKATQSAMIQLILQLFSDQNTKLAKKQTSIFHNPKKATHRISHFDVVGQISPNLTTYCRLLTLRNNITYAQCGSSSNRRLTDTKEGSISDTKRIVSGLYYNTNVGAKLAGLNGFMIRPRLGHFQAHLRNHINADRECLKLLGKSKQPSEDHDDVNNNNNNNEYNDMSGSSVPGYTSTDSK